MGLIAGHANKLYCGLTNVGTEEITWFEVTSVKDVTYTAEMTQHDATCRANGGYKGYVATLADQKFEFQMNWNTDNEEYLVMQSLQEDRTPAYFAALDGEMGDGGDGPVMFGQVFVFNASQTLDGVLVADVTVAPSAKPINEEGDLFPLGWYSDIFE